MEMLRNQVMLSGGNSLVLPLRYGKVDNLDRKRLMYGLCVGDIYDTL